MNSLSIFFCVAIGVFGGITLIKLFGVRGKFVRIENLFDERIKIENNQYKEGMATPGELTVREVKETRYDQVELEKARAEYSQQYAEYVVQSQAIALFPLLGIFGTVLGLVMDNGLRSGDFSGLNMALWTTLAGLVCSIGLKLVDANYVGKMVNIIDSRFNAVDAALDRQLLKDELSRVVKMSMSDQNGKGAV